MLTIEQISCGFGRQEILHDISLMIPEGKPIRSASYDHWQIHRRLPVQISPEDPKPSDFSFLPCFMCALYTHI